MVRLPRLVLPGRPHLVTQRGQVPLFLEESDYERYRDLLGEAAASAGTEIWCYCLLPDQVDAIAVPADEDGLRRAFADTNRRYARFVNARAGRSGPLWRGRFGAVAMDEAHLAQAVRLVSLKPVEEGLVAHAEDWRWSSVRAHLARSDDALVRVAPVLDRYGDFADFLAAGPADQEAARRFAVSKTSGRPLGSEAWIAEVEARTGRRLRPRKRGPKPRGRLTSASSTTR